MQYKIENKTNKEYTKDGVVKQYVSADLIGEDGTRYEKVGAFRGEFSADTWHGELEKKGNYWNLITPKQTAGGNFKTAKIEEAMEKKNQNIQAAQDRSAWMWAKNNAAMLVANAIDTQHMNVMEKLPLVINIATKIYNAEPTEPFTSPIRPSNELSGQNKVNQEMAEKMFPTGLNDDELAGLEDMAF